MDNNIYIENDVVESVFRPISMFLNEIPAGTVLNFDSVNDERTYGKDEKTLYIYRFFGTDGVLYSFTQFDFLNFLTNGEKFIENFKRDPNRRLALAPKFTVNGSIPRKTQDGKIKYPLFALEGYESYKKAMAIAETEEERSQLKTDLFNTKPIEEKKERYYRDLDIDVDIMFYEG